MTLDTAQYALMKGADGKQVWYPVQYDAAQQSIRFVNVNKGAALHGRRLQPAELNFEVSGWGRR
jgi:hypothetical protein